MIENINFPEGTNISKSHDYTTDFYADDFVFLPNMRVSYEKSSAIDYSRGACYKPINIENITSCKYFFYQTEYSTWVPEYNIANMRGFEIQVSEKNKSPKVVLAGGSEYLDGYANIDKLTKFWLRYGDNWDRLKGIMSLDAKVYPYGEVLLRLRILKDGVWMAGEEVRYIRPDIDVPMEYLGGGVYGYTVNILPRDIHRYLIEVGEDTARYAVVASDEETILYIGDNSDLQTQISGTYILDYATSNPNNWSYDTTVGGVRSNDINDNQNTYMTLTLPVNTINLQYGQASESGFDYCTIYDGNGNTLISLKGSKTLDTTITLTSPDKIFKFEYKKDGSGSNDEDAFWIKSISWESLPPYPNN